MAYLLQRRALDVHTSRDDVVLEQWVADNPPRHFTDLVDASVFLNQAFPGNEIRAGIDGWIVIWWGLEIARLIAA